MIYRPKITLLLLPFILIHCVNNEREDCNGLPEIINSIDSISVNQEDQSHTINLWGNDDSIFRHSSGKLLSVSYSGTLQNVQVSNKTANVLDGQEAIITFSQKGDYQLRFVATDDCEKTSISEITLTVL